MLFSVDYGNSAMKTPNFVFPSGLADYPIRPPVDTDVLEYGGKYWTLSGQRISYMRDKTKDDRYFVLTLFAIAKELQRQDAISPMVETDLAVGLPPEHYALRTRFAEYFKRGTVAQADFVPDPKANAIGYGLLATAQLRRMTPQTYGGEFIAEG